MKDEWYLIWSNEHRGWWRAGSHGYTRNLNEAGTYNRETALTICRDAIPTATHIDMISELPVRMTDVNEFLAGQLIPEAIRKERRL